MGSKKISYNDLKKNYDSSQLEEALSGDNSLSKNWVMVRPEDIKKDPKGEFNKIFPFDEEFEKVLVEQFIDKGYDKTQVVHLAIIKEEPETSVSPIQIDGAHRVGAAIKAGIEEIPCFVHVFETRAEALLYAYGLQLYRRNLTPGQKLAAMQKMDFLKNPGRKASDEQVTEDDFGKSSEKMAEKMGVSARTVEKMRNILNNGDEETIEAVKSGKMSVSGADRKINAKKKKSSISESDDISDALEDNSGDPRGIVIGDHSDHIERPDHRLSRDEDIARTAERRKAYESGFSDGFIQAARYILHEIENGNEVDLTLLSKDYEELKMLSAPSELESDFSDPFAEESQS